MTDFRMPSLGADMEAGTLVEWLVKPGDKVKRGDVVAVVETQKGAIEIEIFNDGVLSELVMPVGSRVPVGTVLARLNGATVAAPPSPKVEAPQPPSPPPPAPAVVVVPPVPVPPTTPGRPHISPAARRLAAERGIDIAQLKGTGPGGAITVADVEALQRPPPPRRPGAVQASIQRPCVRRSPPQ